MDLKSETLTELLSQYILTMSDDSIPTEITTHAKNFLTDTYACILAGAREKPALIAREYAKSMESKDVASIFGSGNLKTDSYHAAMVNGIAAHYHDYDDVCTTMIGHPSVVVLPAVLALGEELKVTGKELLCAYITGVEVCALLGLAFSPEHNKIGWHSTSSLAVFGSTAASAKLLKLNKKELTNALGIAASESCGLKGNYGTMTKPLHAGRAASKGIMAAKLAKLGYTSNRSIMEMESGFIKVTTRAFHEDRLLEAIKSRYSEFTKVGLIMKPWPSCKATHNGIWAMLQLMEKYKISSDEIEHITCNVLPYAFDVLKYDIAKTPTEGKFSMNYCIALIALQKSLSMKDFEGTTVNNPQLIDMMNRVEMISDDTLIPGAYFHNLESTEVRVELKNGVILSERCDYAKGSKNNPMTKEEMHLKWTDCMSKSINKNEIDSIINMLLNIEDVPQINEFTKIAENAVFR